MPVDLDEHLRAFERRVPIAAQPEHGISRSEARELAKLLHPDARLARRRAGVATAQRDHAGRWLDPQLQSTVQNILEGVPHRWIPMAQIGFTLPINGRLDKQRKLADRKRDEALIAAWTTEQEVANELDAAWMRCAAAQQRVALFAQTCEGLTQLEAMATALVDIGALGKPGQRVFRLERSQQQAAQAMAVANERIARLDVLRRIGLHPDARVQMAPAIDIAAFVAEPSARKAALRKSPRLLAHQLEHATAEANLELQVRMQWPDLQLWPGWQEEDGQPRASFGFNVPLPIFTGNDPAIAQATAVREQTAEALRAEFEQLVQELAMAEIRRDAAEQQAASFAELLQVAAEQVRDSRELAEAGQLDALLMLDALMRVHNVQVQAIAAQETAAHATISINTLLTDPQSQLPATSSASTGEPR